MTLLALVIFRDEKVDISVIEVGLGGRLDSTNVIDSNLSVITQISKDHTNILGDTLIKISNEKGGIIKSKTPLIISKQLERVEKNLENIAKRKNSEIYHSSDIKIITKLVN